MGKVLVVDDSRSIRQFVAAALQQEGYASVQAEDGVIGLALAQSDKFDAVITDVNMPNMGGIQLVRELRLIPDYQSTPILMLTTEFESSSKQEGRTAGASGWIIKPIDPEKLCEALQLAMNSRQSE